MHNVLSFRQYNWLKKYIHLNTKLRTWATTEFEKYVYKHLKNSVFGETMAIIRSRVVIRLCLQGKQIEKLIAKPNFRHRKISTENLVAVHMAKTNLTFNKYIYVGMFILDLSKTCIHDFHYNKNEMK